ncbi:hypothetical protein EMIHUDRAFT_242707 [Emiliania huxleyi CCMP1516]|uniref:TLDc domain-containing protein n=2 Tax=Emiliania huxleyi TaxID=2903 RepID=A0A0D3J886_EMIH1|nr:hypothetical protein EMIHUDRAFT_242707 [Emiliania huxleyi CCMP1516]EOD19721.1 hypothetical protein EMIHUDRAFT_242707 [Emiliania huxleyi CCMP1516]|eukprot:XP_005772150.1 hypothetical protein EMIHUDRAFT_242707 [Emiliania huxleyi CCMP1516]
MSGTILTARDNKKAFYSLLRQSSQPGWRKKPKLQLLFDSSRDGWNCPTFHQKCDNRGPTVSVCQMQDGTVCGGFTQTDWRSSGNYVSSAGSAFLFRLKYRGQPAPYRANSTGSNDLMDSSSYGPTFGGGQDLMLFYNNNYTSSNGGINMNSYSYPYDPLTGGSYPLTGGYSQMTQPGNNYRVSNLAARRGTDETVCGV